jgi:pimeloyl-ACP methyl ester carboxylesterase
MLTQLITSRGTPLTVYRAGAGDKPGMLFVNAAGMTGHLLDRVAADFQAVGLDMVTWDLRGSPGPTDARDVRLADHVADGMEILRALGISEVHLGGWCTGASVALHIALSLGEAALSFTSVDGAYLFDGVPGASVGNAVYAMCAEIVSDESRASHFLDITKSRGDEEKTLGLTGRPDLVEAIRQPYRQGVPALISYAHTIRATCAYDPVKACAALSIPALFSARRDDRMVGWRKAERAASLVPRAQFALADQGGHYALLTDGLTVQQTEKIRTITQLGAGRPT